MPKSGACRERGKRSGLASTTRPQALCALGKRTQRPAVAAAAVVTAVVAAAAAPLCSTLRTLPPPGGQKPNPPSAEPCQTRENLYSIVSPNPDRSSLRRRERPVADATEPQAASCEVRRDFPHRPPMELHARLPP